MTGVAERESAALEETAGLGDESEVDGDSDARPEPVAIDADAEGERGGVAVSSPDKDVDADGDGDNDTNGDVVVDADTHALTETLALRAAELDAQGVTDALYVAAEEGVAALALALRDKTALVDLRALRLGDPVCEASTVV